MTFMTVLEKKPVVGIFSRRQDYRRENTQTPKYYEFSTSTKACYQMIYMENVNENAVCQVRVEAGECVRLDDTTPYVRWRRPAQRYEARSSTEPWRIIDDNNLYKVHHS